MTFRTVNAGFIRSVGTGNDLRTEEMKENPFMEEKTGVEELYVTQNQKKLRCGYTTGTCAAAAAKASAAMLLSGEKADRADILTPKGILLHLPVEKATITRNDGGCVVCASCAVRKDGGDDIDATNGAFIFAEVCFQEENILNDSSEQVQIEGGKGVGIVTRPGLNQPVGSAAINSVPRRMIRKNVEEVLKNAGCGKKVKVVISVPDGEKIARKTFNPRLGIIGGISILGTSGIVMPMSTQALLDSMRAEMRMLAANGGRYLVITPGNYGETFSHEMKTLDLTYEMKCSNFVGETIDMAVELGISGILFIAHIGKFIKVSGGIMNTHSHEADARAELMAAGALRAGVPAQTVRKILDTATTEDALTLLLSDAPEYYEETMKKITEKIDFYLQARGRGKLLLGAVIFSSVRGKLGETKDVPELLSRINAQTAGKEDTGRK